MVIVLLLMFRESWREPFVNEPHAHIETTIPQNQPATVMALASGINATGKPMGLRLTGSVGTPVVSASKEYL